MFMTPVFAMSAGNSIVFRMELSPARGHVGLKSPLSLPGPDSVPRDYDSDVVLHDDGGCNCGNSLLNG